ncbi:magnesium transporter NIPA-domain-containing protein [Apodospora peruviana]|uniref:Magnesium transporter NIPA-domain-containing protein n=1 Tax=Apodospora peruviana TaxID=516989 RepID=A0AAE0I5H0_9PEZI|nr:magnesium transporter NIPA-domain-containing protein [Apodospora peruviana]
MDQAAEILYAGHQLYDRAGGTTNSANRPPSFKIIGICLAVGSGLFIGTSFVLKKMGLLKANEKYNEVAGEGYGYLKNLYWWGGMTLMILGEGLNVVAYAFTDAILVTPLGALSVVITTILSAIFLKERLSMIGKVSCFLCIIGSVVIVLNAPQESSIADIQQMQAYVVTPGFLTYTGLIVIGSVIGAFWAGPKWGKKNMLVYISICSWTGGLSVVATQGLGAAVIAQAQGKPQFNQWFLYVVLVFFISTLLTEIIFLNKALNLFNAAMVTPTYYVYFTSTTIITSAILFQGFKGTALSIITVVMGFLTICSGVVLLQLSKSAKDVPDAAVLAGDLDQIQTIAEQEQPETEPKADAIRGTAAIIRRLSSARPKMEMKELERLHEERARETLEPVNENGVAEFEWDGLRRRRTTLGSQRLRSATSPAPFTLSPPTPHPPLGWSHFPTEEELAEANRPASPALSSIVGTIRNRARSVLLPGHPDFRAGGSDVAAAKVQSPMHPVQLTEITVPTQKAGDEPTPYYGASGQAAYGRPRPSSARRQGSGASGSSSSRRVQFGGDHRYAAADGGDGVSTHKPPTPPPHSARRQFSFQNVFKRHQAHGGHGSDGAHAESSQRPGTGGSRPFSSRGFSNPHLKDVSEEERLGLVQGDSRNSQSMPALQRYDTYDEDYDEDEDVDAYTDEKQSRYGPSITHSPPRRGSNEKDVHEEEDVTTYQQPRQQRDPPRSRSGSRGQRSGSSPPPPPPAHRYSPPSGGNGGAFI